MRQSAGTLNRTWLTLIGLIALIGATLALLVSTGQLERIATAMGLALNPPQPDDRMLAGDLGSMVDSPGVAVVIALLGVILAGLGLAWIVAQIPRKNEAKPFRLHDDPANGFTTCQPEVITRAVEEEIETLPGITRAAAVLRGTASHPELTVKITANDRTDLAPLLHSIQTEVAENLGTALGVSLRRLAIQLDVSSDHHDSDTVTLPAHSRSAPGASTGVEIA